jgi:Spy/CpxP family protein refolding chaperone
MMKITTAALVAAAMFISSSAFAGDKACCAKGVSNTETTACLDLATLNLTPDQKAKIEAWQAEYMKAGCTKESRKTFLKQAKEILSPEQFAQLKAQCKKPANAKQTQT